MRWIALPGRSRNLVGAALLCLLVVFIQSVAAQELAECDTRPTVIDIIRVDYRRWCLEEVLFDDSAGNVVFTAMVFAPDGTLYATRPLTGEVVAIRDTDDDYLPDAIEVVASGLTRPNGLAYHNEHLYISGRSHIYRLSEDDDITVLVDDIPVGTGFWTGGIEIGGDERIYLAVGAPCDFCEWDDPRRGTILSYALVGSDPQIVASGLRHPADLAFLNGALWTVDTARDGLRTVEYLDELNLVEPSAHFGFPYCMGKNNAPDLIESAFDCETATPPRLSLPTHSIPISLTPYNSDTFPGLTGTLLLVLSGQSARFDIRGYEVVAVHLDDDQNPVIVEKLVPTEPRRATPLQFQVDESGQYGGGDILELSQDGEGLWPHRPYAVAVSPEGWIYFSIEGGRILVIRPLS